MEYLTSIDITGTAIKELPSKFELLVGMEEVIGITISEKRILIPGNKYKLRHLDLLDKPPFNNVDFDIPLAILDHEILLDLYIIREAISNWDERYGGLEALDTVLPYHHLSEVDFIMSSNGFSKLKCLPLAALRGTNTLEGIMLKLPEQRTLYLNATSFLKMKRLQLLIFANVVLSGAIEYLPNELRLIDVPGYQFPTLSFNSGPKQLAILNMPYSHIHQLDKGFKNFERLKVLKLSYSKFLRKFPDLSTAPNVESLYVDNCTSLVEINESVGFLNKLVTLDAQCCSNLRTVPSNLVSKYFRTLNFEGCSKLQMFPNIVEKIELITSLDLSSTAIKQLPSSIDHLVALSKLRLSACKKLVNIPSTIYKLVFLDVHDLSGCKNFSTFPNYDQEIHGNFELRRLNLSNYNISNVGFLGTPFSFPLLELLDLSGNKFVSLPSISKLSKLSELSLANCQQLREIPELPGCQINIKASHYKSLVETPWEIMAKIISNDTGSLCPSRSLSVCTYI
ncbi:hypothetical protein FEM48_Zijuj05G0176700 [Ziziphus jujuba var. spinosa]|uniref:Disease resistance protein RPS4B/Roq1-like leucine-rich repeats domain-containing protein n=1 Tax=Ziziphus jujuba var. spinosa TaxID=714518 RepID=A0A978VG78_ZIZJJ|nr:hypothetical protein FEM48_Zijuj05G0176700 [Ziziphus jujuba var. spinosa]